MNTGEPDAKRPLSDAEREADLAAAPPLLLMPIALTMLTGLGPKLDFGHSCGVAEGIGPGRWQTEARFCSGASAR